MALGAAALGSMLLGCGSGRSYYHPTVVAQGELSLRYDNEFQLWAGGQPVAYGHHYADLPEFVRCVPQASQHASAARSDGYTGTTLSTLGIVFGVGGLGGLAGLAYYDSNPKVMGAFFGAGLASEVLGVVLAAVSRSYKNSANGHAVDAMNYYNDAVGSLGASCKNLTYPPSAGPEPEPQTAPSGGGSRDSEDAPGSAPPKQDREDPREPEQEPAPAPTPQGQPLPIR